LATTATHSSSGTQLATISVEHILYNPTSNRWFSGYVDLSNMKSVSKYVEDGGLDVIVFSLSLMGKNWHEYIAEASRCLNTNGILIIVDTTHSLTEGRLSTLRDIIRDQGFDIHKDEPWDVFTYIEAIKQ
jgi:Hypothetical methyltransferase